MMILPILNLLRLVLLPNAQCVLQIIPCVLENSVPLLVLDTDSANIHQA